ncbi:MAG: hypothetical protein E7610_09475 [Ruminococcaceae bacterium]|nr:hypothetical protein [Oscillospiraceae bacterium]
MYIVTTTDVFPPAYEAEDVLDRLANIGYKTLDMGFDYCINPGQLINCDNWRERTMALRKKADALGVRYTHAHAPYNVASRDEVQMRSFEAAAILGARYIVAHPIHEADGHILDDVDEFIRVNKAAVEPLLPIMEKHGLILLSENILWGATIHPANIVKLVEAVNSPFFSWCYDTGHSHSNGIPVTVLRDLAVPPLSLHIQDTHGAGSGDEHLRPGDGNIDWKEFLTILREIGYKGELVLEAHHQSYVAPDEEKDGILAELLDRAKRMNDAYNRIPEPICKKPLGNTLKFDNQKTRVTAHRGCSGLERENTASAFVAAGNRSYFGIETDVYRTSDGHVVCNHDGRLDRVGGMPVAMESTPLELLQEAVLYDTDGTKDRFDLRVPTLQNYISICKKYRKHCVLELKSDFTQEEIASIISIIEDYGYLDEVTFIAFGYENLLKVRALRPEQSCQFLTGDASDAMIEKLKADHLDIDIYHHSLTEERIAAFHAAGIKVNCWTVDDPARAMDLAAWGVDHITSNILEGIR